MNQHLIFNENIKSLDFYNDFVIDNFVFNQKKRLLGSILVSVDTTNIYIFPWLKPFQKPLFCSK
jgi:hypothetical protein